MGEQDENFKEMIEIAFELTSIEMNYKTVTEMRKAILNLRKKIVTEYMPELIPLKVPVYQEEITVFWECPVCKTGNNYSGSRELVNYYDDCVKCGLSVELIPE